MAPKKKWFKFDLHMHSSDSDGKNSPEEMVKKATSLGLDAIAITDHNTANNFSVKELSEKYGIHIISGCEFSFLAGHFVVLGVEAKIIRKVLNRYKIRNETTKNPSRKKKIKEIFKFLIKKGALIIVAHPKIPSGWMSARGNFLLKLYNEGLIHGAESHNGSLEKKFKKKLYRIWHKRAKKVTDRFGIPPYANTDAHKKQDLGHRFNMIKLDDPLKLIKVLREGRVEIKHGTRSDLN
jgi:histidinol phosphatase-like PHP family hydrolase